jgi:hypothetical protein
MDDTYFKILETLRPTELRSFKDISPIFLETFPNVDLTNHRDVTHYCFLIIGIVKRMRESGYITFKPFTIGMSENAWWIDKVSIMASINDGGISAYDAEIGRRISIELNQSMILTNKSIRETNASFKKLNEEIIPDNFTLQKGIGKKTLLAIAASAFFSLATLCVSIILRDTETPKILQTQGQSLDSLKQSLQRIDASISKAVKDSFYAPLPRRK